ncbi:MAG: AEC family transporter [Rhizobiaceae bacterium]|nr:AEC family transporter [Rhizobiaceae bacterium]
MLSVFFTVFPVFFILGASYLIGRFKYLPDSVADALNAYALRVGVPVLLFLAMYRLDFSKAFQVPMLVSFYTGAVTCFILGIVLSRIFWKRRPGESVAVGFCAVFSNSVLIGIPVVQLAFGDAILAPVFGIIALHASSLYTLGMVTMEFARQDGRGFGETVRAAMSAVMANPLMFGILTGIALNLTGLELFIPLERALDMIRVTAIPVSLVGIGIVLNRYRISSELSEALMVSVLSLFIHPLIAFVLSYHVFGLDMLFVQAATVLAAMPPGMNVYIFANLYKRAQGLSASVLVIANILSVFTISGWLLFMQSL